MTQLYQFLSMSAILISQISGAPRLDGNQLSQFLAVQNRASGSNIWNDQLSQAEKNMILQVGIDEGLGLSKCENVS